MRSSCAAESSAARSACVRSSCAASTSRRYLPNARMAQRGATRAVGELAGEIDIRLGLPALTGFENHGGRTHLGPQANPLARVSLGIGNDGTTEGAWQGSVLGTYSHGPALSRNPQIADLLLRWATGTATLPPIDDAWPNRLRGERLSAAAR